MFFGHCYTDPFQGLLAQKPKGKSVDVLINYEALNFPNRKVQKTPPRTNFSRAVIQKGVQKKEFPLY